MTEKLIEFSTAKLAKEKGFNIPCVYFYPEWKTPEVLFNMDIGEFNKYLHYPGFGDCTMCPTQNLLQKWLRDVHDIHVNPVCNFFNRQSLMGYIYNIDKFINGVHDGICYDKDQLHALGAELIFDSYEKALEAGLLESLKLI